MFFTLSVRVYLALIILLQFAGLSLWILYFDHHDSNHFLDYHEIKSYYLSIYDSIFVFKDKTDVSSYNDLIGKNLNQDTLSILSSINDVTYLSYHGFISFRMKIIIILSYFHSEIMDNILNELIRIQL